MSTRIEVALNKTSRVLAVVSMVTLAITLALALSTGPGSASAREKSAAPAWTGHPNANAIEQPRIETKHELFSEDHTADVVAVEQVWGAYSYYNDTANGPGMASLFTPDGVDQHFWDDGHGKLIPDFGIVAPGDEEKNKTPEGELGSGCILRGRAEIDYYFGKKRTPEPSAWPGHNHHETTSLMVKVGDDGQTAVLTAPFVVAGQNEKGEGHMATGGYRAFMKKTTEGWEIVELYAINDHPAVTPGCDVNGPIGMRQK